MDRPDVIDVLPEGGGDPNQRFTREQKANVQEWLYLEIEDAISANFGVEAEWRECLRMYEGRPMTAVKDTPIPDAPNIEIPLGAIAADAIYAQTIDTIFQASPIVSARAVDERYTEHSKALQRFINWGLENEWGFREGVTHATLDSTQLGTGIYFIPWLEERRKNLTRTEIRKAAPRIRAVPVENFIVPGAACASPHQTRWVALRSYLTAPELVARGTLQDWDIDGVQTTAAANAVKMQRERLLRTKETGESERELVEVIEAYAHFDIDNDGLTEDLLITMDRSSRRIMRLVSNPFDRSRPFESFTYQPRPHLFYGISVISMLKAFERTVTEIHNHRLLNMLLANTRVWGVREGSSQEGQDIWPGKQILLENPRDDLIPLAMGDVYPSESSAESILVQYAERRSGVSDIVRGRSEGLGSRTPGITALSAIQSINQRFAPAFDATRLAAAAAVRQCLYRYQERILMGDPAARDKLMRLLGPKDASLVLELLNDTNFDEALAVELTAASASVNREADRQNSIMVMQFLSNYYQNLLGLMQIVVNPASPPQLRSVTLKIIDAAAEAVDRTLRTFDIVRDPSSFLIKGKNIIGEALQAQKAGEIQQVAQALGAGAAQPPGAPQGAPTGAPSPAQAQPPQGSPFG